MKKLRDPEEPVQRLFSRAGELRSRLGPVLYQLPRQMPKNLERLAAFLQVLPRRIRHTLEFRHPSWYDEDVLRLLRRHHVALCLHDMPDSTPPRVVTARFVYVRFHGPNGRYAGAYSHSALNSWAQWLVSTARPACVYFNNDVGGQAPRDAAVLASLVRTISAAGPGSSQGESTRPTADRRQR